MKRHSNLLIAASAIILLAPASAMADNGLYVGGSVGAASLSDNFDGFEVDTDTTAARLVIGWQFNDYFSLEAGYHRFGEFEQTFDVDGESVNISLEADGFTLGATGAIPIGEKFAIYGRAGSFFWDGNAALNSVSQAAPEDTNLYLGLGASYAIGERVSIIADWSRYELEDTSSNVASLGLALSFR